MLTHDDCTFSFCATVEVVVFVAGLPVSTAEKYKIREKQSKGNDESTGGG